MPALEYLFSAPRKEALAEVVACRVSCRNFTGAPDAANLAMLSYTIGRYPLPGARLMLMPVDESLFTGFHLPSSRAPGTRISGCRMAAAVIACGAEPLCRVHAGILGEALVLEATSHGLGTCWVGGSYKRKQLQLPLAPSESLLALIALGTVDVPPISPVSRKRKPLEQLVKGTLPPEGSALRVAQLVQQAPSAMNLQPWHLQYGAQGTLTVSFSDRDLLEGGIALCHAELALTGAHHWRFSTLGSAWMAQTVLPQEMR